MSNLIHDSNSTISELTKKLATQLTDRGLRLTTAESCTGGNLAVALCAEENTAEFYDVGMVVFSDAAKERILGVRHETIERFTAVSEQTVTEMAAKIREIAEADIGLAISGYADRKAATMAPQPVRSASAGIFADRPKPAPCCFPVNVRMWWIKRCVIPCLN